MGHLCSYNHNDGTGADIHRCQYSGGVFIAADWVDDSGKYWCGLHAPLDARPIDANRGRGAFANEVLNYYFRNVGEVRNEILDLSNTYWRNGFNFEDTFRFFRSTKFPRLNFSNSHFGDDFRWINRSNSLQGVFKNCAFTKKATFNTRLENCDFSDSTFEDKFTLDGNIYDIRFLNCVFKDLVEINAEALAISLDLSGCTFNKRVTVSASNSLETSALVCSHIKCLDGITLRCGSSPIKFITLAEATISGRTRIEGDAVSSLNMKKSSFSELEIQCQINEFTSLESSRVSGGLSASGSHFFRQFIAKDARMEMVVSFQDCKFSGITEFSGCEFHDHANFSDAVFKGVLSFHEAIFKRDALFFSTKSNPQQLDRNEKQESGLRSMNFTSTHFMGAAQFTNRIFLGPLNFNNTRFYSAPDFHDCKFHQDTNFNGAKFHETSSKESAAAYRTLKLLMETARARGEEALFNALEQRSWRSSAKGAPIAVAVSCIYDWGSEYGRSIGRPIGWVIAFFMFFTSVYWSALTGGYYGLSDFCISQSTSMDNLDTAIRYMFTQIVRPFEALTLRAGGYGSGGSGTCVIPGGLAAISTVQTLLHLGSIALVFLAIRRRFKMD